LTDKPKRRIRVRRKRRSGDWVDAEDVADATSTFGCCLFEVILASASAALLVAVPVGLLW
jgi:hypothetical protein